MATHRAIAAVSDAIVRLLESRYSPEYCDGASLQFAGYLAHDFAGSPMEAGASVFLYRIGVDANLRASVIPNRESDRRSAPLTLELHYLLTAWGRSAPLQHAIAGWLLRLLADTPLLPPSLLNRRWPGTFQPDETVELIPAVLTDEEMFRIWGATGAGAYQISLPCVARGVRIESA